MDTTSPDEDTINTSTPDESFTSNKFPAFESVTVSSSPFEPDTVNIIFPLLLCVSVVPLSNEVILEFTTVCVSLNTDKLPLTPFPLTVIADCVNEFSDSLDTEVFAN